jgi:selenocysteine lyase/cysteine desulfurase
MLDRREFFSSLGRPAGVALAAAMLDPVRARAAVRELAGTPGAPIELAADEAYWGVVQRAFAVDRSMINLNNGGVSPSPQAVMDAQRRYQEFSNQAPAYTMWRILEPGREAVREALARLFACDPEEVAITRNTSESLQSVQLGLELTPGDEVLTTTQDYPRMMTTFKRMERRKQVALRTFRIPTPLENPADVVAAFAANITERTRMILISHMVFLTGQVMPVRDVVRLGKARGIPVVVDGAHSFAHLVYSVADLECDYFGTSLHKWLAAPHGTGLLYVRKDKIPGVWPLMAAPAEMDGNIRKFEEIGTHPAAPALAIGEAISFHRGIGPERKLARLRYLRDRWVQRLAAGGRLKLFTNLAPGQSGGIATFAIDGVDPAALEKHLWEKHRIFVVTIKHDEVSGTRVSPSVYTTVDDVDRFAETVEAYAKTAPVAS